MIVSLPHTHSQQQPTKKGNSIWDVNNLLVILISGQIIICIYCLNDAGLAYSFHSSFCNNNVLYWRGAYSHSVHFFFPSNHLSPHHSQRIKQARKLSKYIVHTCTVVKKTNPERGPKKGRKMGWDKRRREEGILCKGKDLFQGRETLPITTVVP